MAKITFYNKFHNSSAQVRLPRQEPGTYRILSTRTRRRIREALCGLSDCRCLSFPVHGYEETGENPTVCFLWEDGMVEWSHV